MKISLANSMDFPENSYNYLNSEIQNGKRFNFENKNKFEILNLSPKKDQLRIFREKLSSSDADTLEQHDQVHN